MNDTTPIDAIAEAIRIAGSQTELARRIRATQGLIHHYVRGTRIPPERCIAIERETGVPCEQLRPDIRWTRGTDGQITGYHVPVSLLTGPATQQPSESGAA